MLEYACFPAVNNAAVINVTLIARQRRSCLFLYNVINLSATFKRTRYPSLEAAAIKRHTELNLRREIQFKFILVIYHSVSNNQPPSGLIENQKYSHRQVGWWTEIDVAGEKSSFITGLSSCGPPHTFAKYDAMQTQWLTSLATVDTMTMSFQSLYILL